MGTNRFFSFFVVLFSLVLVLSFTGCFGESGSEDSGPGGEQHDDDVSDDDDAGPPEIETPDQSSHHGYPEPYDPTQPGPYQVGVRTVIYVDETRDDFASRGKRTLLTEVWYPAVDWADEFPRDRVNNFLGRWYDLVAALGRILLPVEEQENFVAERNAARDVPIHPGGGPYPLILLSHGNGAIRFASMSLGEYLASHGYIVVAPDHIGNAAFVTLPDRLQIYNPALMPFSFIHRIQDFIFLIDHFTYLNDADPEGFFKGRVDVDRVGVAGHSFGAVTAPESAVFDSRIKAVAVLAGFLVPLFLPDDFDTSFMYFWGMEDRTLGDYYPLIRLVDYPISAAPSFLLEFFNAGHYTFTDACVLIPSLMGDGDGCGMGTRKQTGVEFEFIPYDLAQSIMGTYITAFYGLTLKDQPIMAEVLSQNLFPEEIRLFSKLEGKERGQK